jgi:hypothetical protein
MRRIWDLVFFLQIRKVRLGDQVSSPSHTAGRHSPHIVELQSHLAVANVSGQGVGHPQEEGHQRKTKDSPCSQAIYLGLCCPLSEREVIWHFLLSFERIEGIEL